MDLISVLRREAQAKADAEAAAQAEAPTPVLAPDLIAAFSLVGRVAVVTGAAKGIGRGIATALSGAGATVVCADLDQDDLATTVSGIAERGGTASAVPVDVSRRDSVDALVDGAVAAHGQLDIMVNNAGIIVNNRVVDTPDDELDRVLGVNLKGVFYGCAAAVRVMTPRHRGAIVNMASGGMDTPAPTLSVYSMTKAAVAQLTRVLAMEAGPDGIRVNAVAPGFIATPMTGRHFTGQGGDVDEAARDALWGRMKELSPLGVLGEPSDIALAVLYLVSDAAKFVTGQVMRPNGGVVMP